MFFECVDPNFTCFFFTYLDFSKPWGFIIQVLCSISDSDREPCVETEVNVFFFKKKLFNLTALLRKVMEKRKICEQ